MGFSRQEYWSELCALLQGIFPIQGLNPGLSCLLHWQVGSLPIAPSGKPIQMYQSESSHSVVSDSFATPWTVARQAPLLMEFSRQESWSGLPFPSPRDLPDPGIKPGSLTLQVDSLPSEPQGKSLPDYKHTHTHTHTHTHAINRYIIYITGNLIKIIKMLVDTALLHQRFLCKKLLHL